jgi:hypothetical protein
LTRFAPRFLHVEAYSSALDCLNARARGVELSADGTFPETDFARCKLVKQKLDILGARKIASRQMPACTDYSEFAAAKHQIRK